MRRGCRVIVNGFCVGCRVIGTHGHICKGRRCCHFFSMGVILGKILLVRRVAQSATLLSMVLCVMSNHRDTWANLPRMPMLLFLSLRV